jgi:hypothetical protein
MPSSKGQTARLGFAITAGICSWRNGFSEVTTAGVMSALPPKADIDPHGCDVCFVPIADIEKSQKNQA